MGQKRAGQYWRLRRQQQQEALTQKIAPSQEATSDRYGNTVNEGESISEYETKAMDGLC
ncbi:6734_t:CDS:2 [Ambispora gerdemannii]|uniref:6734_t:CDS:1 n=1 Tax=Ambispora gerdemannii TaxID=144530 RepID=A0A9N8V0T4_9GLOM|nr:6734_t:CDS:2 [Ambispora gerdemannii]